MTTLNLLNRKKASLCALLFLSTFVAFSQDPVATSNDEITTVTNIFVFDEEVTDTKNNVIARTLDGDPDTDWAGNLGNATGEASLIYDLGGAYDLAELQYLTVAKSDPYAFQLLVSTTGSDSGDFTDVYGGAKQQSNLDATYKQFTLSSIQTGVKYVKLICFGRINATTEANTSAWNTISELKFYKEGTTASTISHELSQVSLYPSPANNQLSFKNFNDKISKIEIYNVLGKKVLSTKISNSEQTINTSQLVNGIYLVNLSDENNISATKKIIIRH
jgi:poly(beta-D-mannuronate) lyase